LNERAIELPNDPALLEELSHVRLRESSPGSFGSTTQAAATMTRPWRSRSPVGRLPRTALSARW
jgi:hypothetical protein